MLNNDQSIENIIACAEKLGIRRIEAIAYLSIERPCESNSVSWVGGTPDDWVRATGIVDLWRECIFSLLQKGLIRLRVDQNDRHLKWLSTDQYAELPTDGVNAIKYSEIDNG